MESYEIRIVKKGSRTAVLYACPHTSDYAAVRRARSLVQDGDLVEVWRGLDCVYSSSAAPPLDTKPSPNTATSPRGDLS